MLCHYALAQAAKDADDAILAVSPQIVVLELDQVQTIDSIK
jgi:hypothetical protein